jgi:hypothetical protein
VTRPRSTTDPPVCSGLGDTSPQFISSCDRSILLVVGVPIDVLAWRTRYLDDVKSLMVADEAESRRMGAQQKGLFSGYWMRQYAAAARRI